ncbi:MAG: DUF1415 domain-containing protein, partial [Burkholderiales bacterium]|nr:DUF1415 domain-containing protein [Burkholderiales bacterium]
MPPAPTLAGPAAPADAAGSAGADPLQATRHWLERAVIGLGLCPFAQAVHGAGRIRWVLSPATTAAALRATLVDELRHLAAADPQQTETTLIVHPQALRDFLDFNDFLGPADAALRALGLAGTLQIASFHPQYRFAGTRADDIANASNRSPHPTLHLLREASVARAVAALPDAATIYRRNIETLRRLGPAGWQALGLAGAPGPAADGPRRLRRPAGG